MAHSAKPKRATAASEIRRHYYLERYVIMAPKRNLRPDSFKSAESSHMTETPTSPAIERDAAVYQIKSGASWTVKVVANAFPALSLDNAKAYGKQEVLIETPEHNVEFSQLPLAQIKRILDAYIARGEALGKLKGIRYVSIFKNDGPRAGASIAHAHSQIIALPVVPPDINEEARAMDEYISVHGTCPHCDIISWERQQKSRVIYEDEAVVAIVPFAASYPYAVWIMTKQHRARLGDTTATERHSIAVVLKFVTAQLDKNELSFNFFLHDALAGKDHHFYIKVEPRVTTWAGFELSTGMVINPVLPEVAADWYRKQLQ